MELEHKHSPGCRLVFDKNGLHEFGGKYPKFKFSGKPLNQPLHRFLKIDLSDPYAPVECRKLKFLHLLFPLKKSGNGGRIQYQMLAENEIVIHDISEPDDWMDEVEHDHFTSMKARLEPFDYKTRLIIHALDGDFKAWNLNDEDKEILAACDNGVPMRVGGSIRSCQGAISGICKNPSCSHGTELTYDFPILALFSCNYDLVSLTGQDEWGEPSGSGAEYCFCICTGCGSILAIGGLID